MATRSLTTGLMLLVLLVGFAEAQTTVNPADRREIVRLQSYTTTSTYLRGTSYVYNGGSPTYGAEVRLFFEFDLSGQASAQSAFFRFSAVAYPGATGTIYLRPMTSGGEDGSVTTGDFSRLYSPFWSTSVTSSTQSFSVPITQGFNARVGGFGGLALTGSPGTWFVVSGNQRSGVVEYTPVPEPGTFALFGLGLGSLFLGYRVRRRKARK